MKYSVFLRKKLKEIYLVEPNDLEIPWLTHLYKQTTVYFKNKPFLVIIPLSFCLAFFLYLIFGALIVKLTSLLQYGF